MAEALGKTDQEIAVNANTRYGVRAKLTNSTFKDKGWSDQILI